MGEGKCVSILLCNGKSIGFGFCSLEFVSRLHNFLCDPGQAPLPLSAFFVRKEVDVKPVFGACKYSMQWENKSIINHRLEHSVRQALF